MIVELTKWAPESWSNYENLKLTLDFNYPINAQECSTTTLFYCSPIFSCNLTHDSHDQYFFNFFQLFGNEKDGFIPFIINFLFSEIDFGQECVIYTYKKEKIGLNLKWERKIHFLLYLKMIFKEYPMVLFCLPIPFIRYKIIWIN